MASVEFLNKRIEGKKKAIEKLEKTLERINKAKATNWTVNPYWYGESDLKHTEREISLAKVALEGYENELRETIEKDNSRNVPAILEFLKKWKNNAYSYFTNGFTEYYTAYADICEIRDKIREKCGVCPPEEEYRKYEEAQHNLTERLSGVYENRFYKDCRGINRMTRVKVKDGDLEYVKVYVYGRTEMEACDRLLKDLDAEMKAKYDFIIERTNAICGTIVDASNLKVSANGELNGVIIGDRGNATVKTIGAGGYNIQCFHFRVLVHKEK